MDKTCKALSQNKLLKIGELALQADVAVATIRYYESLGLLEPVQRSESGYRYYEESAIKRVQFIKKAQSLQFSLSEIQQVLGVRSQGNPVCPLVRDLLNHKIADLEEQIERMKALKAELEAYRNRWANKPLDDPCSKELCSLIEEVAGTTVGNKRNQK
ncbi:MAG TPA: heavy metal-responsive transcriptional regulator [Cyanobacteria bacterium UBA11369]|nr:heavy metal-responsive transcriptional regulator [Cyanobacteria bacterium UBA11371]HBE53981.1 heavy metal-responsive transcriptional regulator [Cyanobacteria bacterium UBA11369]